MTTDLKILLIEDDYIYKTVMLNYMYQYGINEIDVVDNYREAIKLLASNHFDIVLIDVFISGSKTGISLGHYIRDNYGTPFIYVTANLSQKLLEIMKDTHPVAVISKPIEAESFISTIKLAVYNSNEMEDFPKCLGDRIFIKKDGIFDKLFLKDITYVESDHVYLNIHTKGGKRVMIRGRLMDFYKRFPDNFLQINRGCAINVNYVDHFDKQTITVNNRVLEISRKFKSLVQAKLVTF